MPFLSTLRNWFKKFRKQLEAPGRLIPVGKEKEPLKEKPPIIKKAKKHKTINVGIDLGTSSTKILYRDITENKGSYLDIFEDIPWDGYNPFCMSSTIAINDNKIYFSSQAEKIADKSLTIRSFKICLVCEIMGSFDRCSSKDIIQKDYDESQCRFGKEDGLLIKIDNISSTKISTKEFTTYFLAYVINCVRNRIDKKYSEEYILNYTYNTCAPIDQYSNDLVKQCYERILFLAEKLSHSMHNGIEIREAKKLYLRLDEEWKEIPGEEARNTFILPETLASIMSYINSRRATNGLYAIVDIGAGTTDISFFRHASLAGNVEAIYAAKTIVLGMDNFDTVVYQHIVQSFPDIKISSDEKRFKLLQEIRVQKEKYKDNQSISIKNTGGELVVLEKDSIEELAGPLRKNIFGFYKSVWQEAYAKEVGISRWRNLILYIIGGGSKSIFMIQPFLGLAHRTIKNFDMLWADIESGIINLTGLEKELKDSSFLFSVAQGLSYHKVDWGQVIRAFEVAPLPPKVKRQYRDRDDDV